MAMTDAERLAEIRRGQLAEIDRELASMHAWAAGETRERELRHLERKRAALVRRIERESARAAKPSRRARGASPPELDVFERPETLTAEQFRELPRERPQLELAARRCAWCRGAIPKRLRADALCCSTKCRQARHRFAISPAAPANGRPMRFAYADPPYPKCAKRYYGTREIDHEQLVVELCRDYPDGWALSTSSKALRAVLVLCPADVRVHVWVRGGRRSKARHAHDAFEALIVWRGRVELIAEADPLCNVLAWSGRQHSHPDALVGMKPAAFCEWMFRLLGARRGDELVDLYRGSGSVRRAWLAYAQPSELELDDGSRAVVKGLRDGSRSRLSEAQGRLDASLVDAVTDRA